LPPHPTTRHCGRAIAKIWLASGWGRRLSMEITKGRQRGSGAYAAGRRLDALSRLKKPQSTARPKALAEYFRHEINHDIRRKQPFINF
jgi:hypothetical protein